MTTTATATATIDLTLQQGIGFFAVSAKTETGSAYLASKNLGNPYFVDDLAVACDVLADAFVEGITVDATFRNDFIEALSEARYYDTGGWGERYYIGEDEVADFSGQGNTKKEARLALVEEVDDRYDALTIDFYTRRES